MRDETFCYNTQLEYIIFATGSCLRAIGNMAFVETGLHSVDLPAGVRELGQAVFAGCDMLQHMGLPDGLEEIPADLCADTSLTEIVIPKTVRQIGPGAFQNCHVLSRLRLPRDN